MNLLLDKRNDKQGSEELKDAFNGGPSKGVRRDINERYAEKLLKQIKFYEKNKELSQEKFFIQVKSDMESIKGLSVDEVKKEVYEKLKEAKLAVVTKLFVFLVHGWDAAFGPKPKK
jgi:hypothetical protein